MVQGEVTTNSARQIHFLVLSKPNYKTWRQENSTTALPTLSDLSSHDGFLRRHQQHCIWELLQTQMFASPQKLWFGSFIMSFKCHLLQRPSLAVAKIAISQSPLTSCPSRLSFSCIIYWHKIHLTVSSYYTGCLSLRHVTRQGYLLILLCYICVYNINWQKQRRIKEIYQ